MVYGDFENTQSGTRSTHLHLEIPTIGLLTHAEPLKCIPPNRAKRTHVGVTNSVKESQNDAGAAPGKNLLEIHAARLTAPPRARADHEIILSCKNWIDKVIHELGAIASVAIEKYDDIAFR